MYLHHLHKSNCKSKLADHNTNFHITITFFNVYLITVNQFNFDLKNPCGNEKVSIVP